MIRDNSRKYDAFRVLDLIFIFMLSFQILFLLISYILVREEIVKQSSESGAVLKIAAIVLTLILVLSAKTFHRIIIKNNPGDNPESLIYRYRTLSLVRLAVIEASVLLNIVIFLIIHDYIFLLIALVLLVLFFAYRPSREAMAKEFNLSAKDIN